MTTILDLWQLNGTNGVPCWSHPVVQNLGGKGCNWQPHKNMFYFNQKIVFNLLFLKLYDVTTSLHNITINIFRIVIIANIPDPTWSLWISRWVATVKFCMCYNVTLKTTENTKLLL